MGRVLTLKTGKKKHLPKEFSAEEEQLVKELHQKIGAAARHYHEVIICKAIGVYMGDVMVSAENPGMVIGGFMKHIEMVANIAIAQHKRLEKLNAPKVLGTKEDETGQQRPGDADTPEGGDRSVEVAKEQEVLLPPTLQ